MSFGKTIVRFLVILLIMASVLLVINYTVRTDKQDASGPEQSTDVAGQELDKLKRQNQEVLKQAKTSPRAKVGSAQAQDHIWGSTSSPVQLIIYDNFVCSYCTRFYDTVEKVKQEFGDRVAVVYRHYPMRIHPMAYEAALASECAAEQGKFWEMYDKLFQASKDNGLSRERMISAAQVIGLDAAQFSQCLDTEKYRDKVQKDYTEGKDYGVTGTPASFLNGRPLTGAVPYEDYQDSQGRKRPGMKNLIKGALGQARPE